MAGQQVLGACDAERKAIEPEFALSATEPASAQQEDAAVVALKAGQGLPAPE